MSVAEFSGWAVGMYLVLFNLFGCLTVAESGKDPHLQEFIDSNACYQILEGENLYFSE